MQVDMVTTNGAPTADSGSRPIRPQQKPNDEVLLHSGETLRAALEEQDEVRPEVVERGRDLWANVQYPPAELINGLSKLLADHLENPL